MYTDDDLNRAVEERVFTSESVAAFRQFIASTRHVPHADEEGFRLLSGFNDFFVLIASGLMLVSAVLLLGGVSPTLAATVCAVLAWGLAEFFVRKRRMALPAIGLLVAFIASVGAIPLTLTPTPTSSQLLLAAVLAMVAAFVHWKRFSVPITVAAGITAVGAAVVGAMFRMWPMLEDFVLPIMAILGILVFALAMYWDSKDTQRITRASDVAFWLHLVAAPLIVHPVFSSLGLLEGHASVAASLVAVALYVGLALVSIAVDRRAIMVSSLVYLIYAFSGVLENYGLVSYSFALTGMLVGATLLILSAYWAKSRNTILAMMPMPITKYLPTA
ncbi:hypothetical protein OE749_17330 [Aestuariibacter sp. AA17]|uniref:DUF2157 domain-containing protein n=1 Tax=Fluctibacter corallii TaxID=2984329 RepID=A0ABT3ACQ5_9ALTE|nr:hypothetical protein [Aestuariibacter sp. AA17]MCV2886461.1 hypothetical protein [Aestuariibacter sp. AA17]